jgi:ankyrin repeat protein
MELYNHHHQSNLLELCTTGSLPFVKAYYQLHSNHIDLSTNDEEIFLTVCRRGYLDIAQWVVEVNPHTNISAREDYSFIYACRVGNLQLAQWLLHISQKQTPDGKTTPTIDISSGEEDAFCFACECGHLEVAQWLLQIKPTIDVSVSDNLPFFMAVSNGHLEVAQWIFEIHPDMKSVTTESFLFACCYGHLDTAKWLMQLNPQMDIAVGNHFAFHGACTYGQLAVAQWLLEMTPDINIHDNNSHTFISVCEGNHTQVALWFAALDPRYVVTVEDENIVSYHIRMPLPMSHTILFVLLGRQPSLGVENEEMTCPICYESCVTIKTNCSHCFCLECIQTHYDRSTSCPYCRTEITECCLIVRESPKL